MREKHFHYRDENLLKLARGKFCLLQIPGVCYNDPATVVAAHSNKLAHGKGMGIKSDDFFSVWACASCHSELDQGRASSRQKDEWFEAAHARQLKAWDNISEDESASDKDRRTATDALIAFDKWSSAV